MSVIAWVRLKAVRYVQAVTIDSGDVSPGLPLLLSLAAMGREWRNRSVS